MKLKAINRCLTIEIGHGKGLRATPKSAQKESEIKCSVRLAWRTFFIIFLHLFIHQQGRLEFNSKHLLLFSAILEKANDFLDSSRREINLTTLSSPDGCIAMESLIRPQNQHSFPFLIDSMNESFFSLPSESLKL